MWRLINWLWGYPLGKLVRMKSWVPSIDRLHRGVGWPTALVDQRGQRSTITPIWNRVWLRNRLGFKEKHPHWPQAM